MINGLASCYLLVNAMLHTRLAIRCRAGALAGTAARPTKTRNLFRSDEVEWLFERARDGRRTHRKLSSQNPAVRSAGYFRNCNLSADCVTNGGEYIDQLARRSKVAHQRHLG